MERLVLFYIGYNSTFEPMCVYVSSVQHEAGCVFFFCLCFVFNLLTHKTVLVHGVNK